jgi:hypothetical protein
MFAFEVAACGRAFYDDVQSIVAAAFHRIAVWGNCGSLGESQEIAVKRYWGGTCDKQ